MNQSYQVSRVLIVLSFLLFFQLVHIIYRHNNCFRKYFFYFSVNFVFICLLILCLFIIFFSNSKRLFFTFKNLGFFPRHCVSILSQYFRFSNFNVFKFSIPIYFEKSSKLFEIKNILFEIIKANLSDLEHFIKY